MADGVGKQGWLAGHLHVSDAHLRGMLADKQRWTDGQKRLAARALEIPVEIVFAALDMERPGGYPTLGQRLKEEASDV